jgi:hypothetical protein
MTQQGKDDVVDLTLGKRPQFHDTLFVSVRPRTEGLAAITSGLGVFICYLAAGPSLGLFFGGFFVVTFLAPAASLLAQCAVRSALAVVVVAAVASAVWLIAVFQSPATIWQWMQLSAVLVAYAMSLGGIARAASRTRVPKITASALSIVIGFLWLTWPIWLAPQLAKSNSTQLANLLVAVHPPLVANGVLSAEEPWTEKPLAYRLTNLNQDIAISLPRTAWACFGFHGTIAGVLWLASSVRSRKRAPAPVTV